MIFNFQIVSITFLSNCLKCKYVQTLFYVVKDFCKIYDN